MQKHYLTLNLEKKFNENTIWDNLFKTNLNNIVFWEPELLSFKLFLQSEIDKLLQSPTSWDKTYFPLKKIISAVQYVSFYQSATKNTVL